MKEDINQILEIKEKQAEISFQDLDKKTPGYLKGLLNHFIFAFPLGVIVDLLVYVYWQQRSQGVYGLAAFGIGLAFAFTAVLAPLIVNIILAIVFMINYHIKKYKKPFMTNFILLFINGLIILAFIAQLYK